MKKFIFFLFLPSVCFGSGTMRINQGSSGGGIVEIQGGSGSGGGGTITEVDASTGIIGGGVSGAVSIAVDPSTVTIQGVFIASTNVTLTPGAGFTLISSTASFPATVISTQTTGAGNFIFNQNTLQSGSTFYVTSGTVQGIFTVEQPDNDTTDGPISLKTVTTKEGASTQYHSMYLYGVIPNPSVNGGEFVITVASQNIASPGSFPERNFRPEIAMVGGDFLGGLGVGSQSQYIAFRSRGNQFPNGAPYGDLYLTTTSIVSNDPHRFSSTVEDGTGNPGLSGQVWTSQGSATYPHWTTASSGVSVYPATSTASFPFGFSATTAAYTSSVTIQGSLSVGTTTAISNLQSQVHIVTPGNRIGLVVQDPPNCDSCNGTGSADLAEFWDDNGVVLSSITASGAFVTASTSSAKWMILKGQSAGVAHIVATSSQIVSGLVSLSTEVTGVLPLANMNSSVSSTTAGVTVYNGGVALSTTQAYNRNFYYIPYACTITSATIMQDSGSITYDVKISSNGNFPITNSMVGSGTKPSVTSGTFFGYQPSDWQQTNIPAGSQIEFTVEAATTTRKSTLVLTLFKT